MRTNLAITRKTKLAQAIALTLTALAVNPAQATDYSFTDLRFQPGTYSPVHDINNLGQAVGELTTDAAAYATAATYWDGAQWHTLGGWQSLPWNSTLNVPVGSTHNVAYGINDSDQIAGYTGAAWSISDMSYPTLWNNGVGTQLDVLQGPGSGGLVAGISNNGRLAGGGYDGGAILQNALTWNPGETAIHDLGTLGGSFSFVFSGKTVNDAGQIIGGSATTNDDAIHAVVWQNLVIHDLGTLGGTASSAFGINQGGQIIGYSNDLGDADVRAVLWADATSAPVDLGTLGGANALATGINDLGQIVGWSDTADGQAHLTLWDHGQIVDLTTYLAADLLASGLGIDTSTLAGPAYFGTRINNAGVILGNFADGNYTQTYSFLLPPAAVPVPGAVWLFGSALAGFMGMKRRKNSLAV